jgi:hypothetical protein
MVNVAVHEQVLEAVFRLESWWRQVYVLYQLSICFAEGVPL